MYTMTREKEYYVLDFNKNNFEKNLEHMKSEVESLRYRHPDGDEWRAPFTPRNNNIFRRLNDENIYEMYEKEKPPDIAKDILNHANIFMNINNLMPYQIEMISHMYFRKRCINAAEMRMGKTLPTLILISYFMKEYDEPAVFVTKKMAKYGIYSEIYKWKIPYLDNLKIMTYDYFTDHFEDVPFILVFDEAQSLKNESLRTFKAIDVSQKQIMNYEESYTILLSGTPAPNHQDDWFYLTEICLPGFLAENSKINLLKRLSIHHIEERPTGGKYIKVDAWIPEEIKALGEERLVGLVEVYSKAKYLKNLLPPKKEVWSIPPSEATNVIYKNLKKLYSGSKLDIKQRKLSDGIYESKYWQTPKDRQLSKLIELHEDIGRLVIYGYFKDTINKLCKIVVQQHDWDILKITGNGMQAINSRFSADELLMEMDESRRKLNCSLVNDIKLVTIIQCDICEGMEFSASPTIVYYSNSKIGNSRVQSEARINTLNSRFHNQRIIDLLYLDCDLKIYQSLLNKQGLSNVVLKTLEMEEKEKKEYYKNLNEVEVFSYVEDQSYDYFLEGEEFESDESDEPELDESDESDESD